MLPQIVVMAGGLGTRLGGAYSNIPKILAPVNGKPFLVLQLEKLISEGARRIHYLLGHKSDQVISLLLDLRLPIELSFSVEPPELLGTGGGLMNSVEELDDEFLLTYGDSYLIAEIDSVFSRMRNISFSNIMCVTYNLDQESSPNVILSTPRVIGYSKQNCDIRNNALDYGLMKFRKESLMGFIPQSRNYDLEQIFNFLIENENLYSLTVNEGYFDIGSPSRLKRLEEYLSENTG
jgi:D-glycero-alpha-D-manno-heptose 1-phosphate guanylyltransferase